MKMAESDERFMGATIGTAENISADTNITKINVERYIENEFGSHAPSLVLPTSNIPELAPISG
jgi:hypothetical protein